jgi:DNA modification methylase
LGLEPTFHEYIDKLTAIFDEVKRVLKKTGSCWVVLGDTYGTHSGGWGDIHKKYKSKELDKLPTGLEKSLLCIPERFAIEMISRGWILRNKIVWHKPNCMPSSAKDRFTVDYENVFFFTKSSRYYFETQYEQNIKDPEDIVRRALKTSDYNRKKSYFGGHYHNNKQTEEQVRAQVALGRIKRCVWKISTRPYSGAHFAVFPPELIETPIKATCPEYVCRKCGFMRQLVYEETRINTRPGNDVLNAKSGHSEDPNQSLHVSDLSKYRQQIVRTPKLDSRHLRADGSYYKIGGNKYTEAAMQSGNPNIPMTKGEAIMTDCGCGAPFESGIVLDPFMGAGTTALVALKNARNFVGIELNPKYIKLANDRIRPLLQQQRLEIAI